MAKFTMIPEIYAGDLPYDVRNELEDWDNELCFHGDGGCVFTLRQDSLENLPRFKKWMIEIGAWTEDEVDLMSYEKFCYFNKGKVDYKEYYDFLKESGKKEFLSVAMTGT